MRHRGTIVICSHWTNGCSVTSFRSLLSQTTIQTVYRGLWIDLHYPITEKTAQLNGELRMTVYPGSGIYILLATSSLLHTIEYGTVSLVRVQNFVKIERLGRWTRIDFDVCFLSSRPQSHVEKHLHENALLLSNSAESQLGFRTYTPELETNLKWFEFTKIPLHKKMIQLLTILSNHGVYSELIQLEHTEVLKVALRNTRDPLLIRLKTNESLVT